MLKLNIKTIILSCIFYLFLNPNNITLAKNIDVNNDGIINHLDLHTISIHTGSDNKQYDINNDGIVDALDIAIVAKQIPSSQDSEAIFTAYDKNGISLDNFSKDNLINAISLASQNNGVVKYNDFIIWDNNSYFVYSNNEPNTSTKSLRNAVDSASLLDDSIVISKNGNVVYNKNLNFRKIIGVTRERVNLRSEPKMSARTDIMIPEGVLLEVSNIINGFYNVLYYDENNNLKTGYIPSYIDIIQDDINRSQLGYISAREESNGDPGAIGLNPNDKGGASFGVWQLASKTGSVDEFIKFIKDKDELIYLKLTEAKNKYNGNFEENFISTWKEIAYNQYEHFYELQRLFIKKNYYDSFIKIANKNNLNVDSLLNYNSTSNMIWSTAVQHGASGAVNIIKKISLNSSMDSIIESIYTERLNIISKSYPPNSSNPGIVSLYNGIKNRLENEKMEILRIYKRELSY